MASETSRLLRRPGYARYFTVVAAARATGTMFNVAAPLLVLERTGSLTLAGLVVAAATLPGAVTGPILGAWLDVTASRRRLLVFDRAVTVAALAAILVLAGHAANWLLPVVAVLYGATTPLSAGAFSSVLPELAGVELLGIANTFEATSINTAFIVGPALAGVITGAAGAAAAILVQLGAGVVLAALMAGDETFELRPADSAPAPSGVRQAVAQGLWSLWRIAPLRWNTLIGAIYVTGWGMLNVGFPAYAVKVGAGTHSAGYMWAAVSLGSMLSAFAFRGAAAHLGARQLIGISFLSMAASVAVWTLAGGLAPALALIFLTGILEGPSLVALISVRQRLAPARLRGQIFSTASSLDLAAIAAGAAIAGPLQAASGTDATLLAVGALLGLAGVVSLLTESDGEGDARGEGASASGAGFA
ncbi:MAG: MFS transporter [Solirubrobacterales bacterium]|nr:MFS transporter [Solirubrobacterales bacterium]